MSKLLLIILIIVLIIYILTARCTKTQEHFLDEKNRVHMANTDIDNSYTKITTPKINENINALEINEGKNINKVESNDINKIDGNDKCEELAVCNAKTCGKQLYPVMDPEFNMREVSKQCLLLEDHLNNSKKRCIDCIKKHFLIIDGMLEEAVSLEKDNKLRDTYRNIFLKWVEIEKKYVANQSDPNNIDEISKEIRLFRKPLVEQYFDNVSTYSE